MSAANFPPDHWEEPPDSGAEELLLYSPNHGEMPGALHSYPVEDESKRASDEEDHSIKEYDNDNLDEYDDSDEYEDSDDQLGLQDFSPQQKYKVATEAHAIIRRQLEQQDLDADSRIPLLDELGKHEDYIVAKKK